MTQRNPGILRPRIRHLAVGALSLALLCACDKEEPSTESKATEDESATRGPALDPDLAKAVAAASAAPSPGAAPTGQADGPPPNGIFPPGRADREIRSGQPPTITVGSQGSEPRVQLKPGLESPIAGKKVVETTIQVAVQSGPQQGALPIDFSVDFKDEGAVGEGDDPSSKRRRILAEVKEAALPANLGRLPPQMVSAFGKLRGSKIRYELWPNGGSTAFTLDIPKDAPAEAADMIRALSDAIAAVTLPYPEEAMGTGGFFMATSRDGVMGLDLVTYRMVRIERVAGDTITLNLSTKRYATSEKFDMVGLAGDFTLEQFASQGDGSLRYRNGLSLPVLGQLTTSLNAALIPAGQSDRRGALQLGTLAKFNLRGQQVAPPEQRTMPALPPGATPPSPPQAPTPPAPSPAPAQ